MSNMTEIFEVKKWWKQFNYKNLQVDTLITGIGPAMCSFYLARALAYKNYDLAINAGIAGSFSSKYKPGGMAWVSRDQFGDLGISDGDNFCTLYEKGFESANKPPFREGALYSQLPDMVTPPAHIKEASAITVSSVSGEEKQIQLRKDKFKSELESMEGAAFMFACQAYHLPCLQLRAVSNMITAPRDEKAWKTDESIQNLNQSLTEILDKLETK